MSLLLSHSLEVHSSGLQLSFNNNNCTQHVLSSRPSRVTQGCILVSDVDPHQLDTDPDPCRPRPLIRIRILPKIEKIPKTLKLFFPIKINMLQKITLLCFV